MGRPPMDAPPPYIEAATLGPSSQPAAAGTSSHPPLPPRPNQPQPSSTYANPSTSGYSSYSGFPSTSYAPPSSSSAPPPAKNGGSSSAAPSESGSSSLNPFGRDEKSSARKEAKEEKRRSKLKEKETSAEAAKENSIAAKKGSAKAGVSIIPPEAQKAISPLSLSSDAKNLVGMYAVELPPLAKPNPFTPPAAPTQAVNLTTAKHDIDLTLYFREPTPKAGANEQQNGSYITPNLPYHPFNGAPPTPPVEVLATSKKGRIRLSIPERGHARPWRIICRSEASIGVQLPTSFDGKLAIWAPSGTIELSEPLKRNSTIIPSTQNNPYITVWRIIPSDSSSTSSAASGSTGPNGAASTAYNGSQAQGGTTIVDLCQINSNHGRVKAEYARPPRMQDDSNCVVM